MAKQSTSDPSSTLGPHGRQLWATIMAEHHFRDAGALAVLAQAAKAIDAAEQYGAIIERDGPVLQSKSGPRDHPLIRHQIASRALACRLLSRLGVVAEVKKRVGRPSYGLGISYEQLEESDAL